MLSNIRYAIDCEYCTFSSQMKILEAEDIQFYRKDADKIWIEEKSGNIR